MTHKAAPVVSIDWKPDKAARDPLYKQIVNYASMKIFNGDWVIGQKLPSQRKLAELFGVNRSTIVEALEELSSLGIIEGNFGHGTTIVNNTWSLLMSNAPPNWQSYIDAGIFKANFPTIQTINKLEYVDGITRLSTGELSPDLFPHEMMEKVLVKIPERVRSLSYLEPLGLLELRQVLSRYLARFGILAPPSCILIVSGALQALQLISLCTLKPGSNIFLEIPSYLKSLHVFQSAGMRLCGIPMGAEGIMPWMIEMINKKNLKAETALLYTIPTFHNPTGKVMTEARRTEVMDYCNRNRLPIIEDDVFQELWLDEPPPYPIKAQDKNGIVLYLGSISKSLAPGLRLGWLVGPESVVQHLGDVKMQIDYGSSTLSQWALTEWIESGLFDEHMRTLRFELRKRRNFTLEILNQYYHDIATWNKPTGGYYIWMKLNKNISTDKLFKRALEDKLLINPGNLYDFSNNQYVRISYSYASDDALSEGLIRLSEIIRRMLGETP